MTDGPQQPHNPPPGEQSWQPDVLRGDIVGEPQQPHRPSWNAPADWAPPLPGHGTRGPSTPVPPPVAEPDWSALADASEARAKRRKLLLIGGGAIAVAAIAGIVAMAVVSSGHRTPAASPTGAPSTAALPPQPSFPSVSPAPTYNALDFISSAGKDTAPLSVGTLFPEKKELSWAQGARTYTKTASTGTDSCTSAASGALGTVLKNNGCRHLFRVTYVRGTVAVTVGVAVFDEAADADRTKQQVGKGYVLPLAGGGQSAFCRATSCRLTTNAKGRYAYFTIAGLKNNKAVTSADTLARQAGTDTGAYAFSRIVQRGKDAAAKAAAAG